MKKFAKLLVLLFVLTVAVTCLVACGHTCVYDKEIVDADYLFGPATCTQKARYYYSCECGKNGTETFEYGEKLGHDYSSWISNGDGTHTKTCANDNTHKITENCGGRSATCTTQAVCDNCGEFYGSTISHNHNILKKSDFYHWYECACGDYETKENHIPGEEATETTDQKCTVCNYVITHALGHVHTLHLTKVNAKLQSCTEEGNIEYYTCSCGKWFTDNTATTEITDKMSVVIQKDEHQHTILRKTATEHWWECSCGDKNGLEGHHGGTATCTQKAVCVDCGLEYGSLEKHKHTELKKSDVQHWYECACGDKDSIEGHKGGEATCLVKANCSICGVAYGNFAEHSPKQAWMTTDTHHYHECIYGCTEKLNHSEHNFDENKRCTVCDYVTTALLGTEISSTVYEINGTNLIVIVSNTQTIFSFANTINVANGATYKVYTDIGCKEGDCIPSYVVNDLVVGENTYYILVSNGNMLPQVYTVTIQRLATYTVEYYIENIEDSDYTLLSGETESLFAIANTTVYAEIKNFEHFIAIETNVSEVVNASGTVLKVYYKRERFTVTFNGKGGTLVDGEDMQTVKYGGTVVPPVFEKEGYTFISFDKENFENVSESFTVTANWEINQYKLTIVYGDGETDKVITLDYGSKIAIEEPKRAGYDFAGWSISIMPAKDATVYAEWNAIFTLNGGKITGLTAYGENNYTELEIPSQIDGVEITSIGSFAFEYCSSLKAITIPDSVTSIGDRAFRYCHALTSITIPDSVTSIGGSAFSGCTSLKSVTFGENSKLESIGYSAFKDCTSLTSITIPDSVKSIGGEAFVGCVSLVKVNYLGTIDQWVEIEFASNAANPLAYAQNLYINNVLVENVVLTTATKISDYAFSGCDSLTSITIPDSVTSIGWDAFYKCTSLENMTVPFVGETKDGTSNTHFGYIFGASSYSKNSTYVPSSLKSVTITGGESIGSYAFYDCTSLKSITIPDSVTSIGEVAFHDCSSLIRVNYLGTVDQWVEIDFADPTIDLLSNRAELYINDVLVDDVVLTTATKISDYAFYCYTSLTSITIPDSVTSIGSAAFLRCTSLESVTFEENSKLESIGEYIFSYCTSLKSITIPDSVTSIGKKAFFYCHSLESITIPDSITSIGEYAFSNCDSLETIILGENSNLESIGDYAFEYCSSLKAITIPDSVTSIGDRAFRYCHALTSITIPDSVTSIGGSAFSGCSSLTFITIPDSVTSIGEYAFSNCPSLTIYCEATSKPSGWSYEWNVSTCVVQWGYKGY